MNIRALSAKIKSTLAEIDTLALLNASLEEEKSDTEKDAILSNKLTELLHDIEKFPVVSFTILDMQSSTLKKTMMHWAAEYANIDLLKKLVTQGAQQNLKDKDGNTALALALKQNNPEASQLLVNTNFNIENKKDENAWSLALASQNWALVQAKLTQNFSTENLEGLLYAIKRQPEATLAVLNIISKVFSQNLPIRADFENTTLLDLATQHHHEELLKLIKPANENVAGPVKDGFKFLIDIIENNIKVLQPSSYASQGVNKIKLFASKENKKSLLVGGTLSEINDICKSQGSFQLKIELLRRAVAVKLADLETKKENGKLYNVFPERSLGNNNLDASDLTKNMPSRYKVILALDLALKNVDRSGSARIQFFDHLQENIKKIAGLKIPGSNLMVEAGINQIGSAATGLKGDK